MNIIVVEKLNATESDQAHIDCIVGEICRRESNMSAPMRVIVYDSFSTTTDEMSQALFVSLGGDGTATFAMKLAAMNDGSVISLNLGTLGFLADYTCHEFERFASDVVDIAHGVHTTTEMESRSLLVARRKGCENSNISVNEFHLAGMFSGTLLNFEIKVGGQLVGNQRGDGVLVSTPTGSTAYSLSSGGAIMSPDTDVAQINIVSPNTMTSRPLVVPLESKIEISVIPKSNDIVTLRADGRQIDQLDLGDEKISYEIEKYSKKVTLWHKRGWNYYDVLSHKMLWWKRGK